LGTFARFFQRQVLGFETSPVHLELTFFVWLVELTSLLSHSW